MGLLPGRCEHWKCLPACAGPHGKGGGLKQTNPRTGAFPCAGSRYVGQRSGYLHTRPDARSRSWSYWTRLRWSHADGSWAISAEAALVSTRGRCWQWSSMSDCDGAPGRRRARYPPRIRVGSRTIQQVHRCRGGAEWVEYAARPRRPPPTRLVRTMTATATSGGSARGRRSPARDRSATPRACAEHQRSWRFPSVAQARELPRCAHAGRRLWRSKNPRSRHCRDDCSDRLARGE